METRSKAQKNASALRLEYSVCCRIHAPPEKIWALLTDARRFPSGTRR